MLYTVSTTIEITLDSVFSGRYGQVPCPLHDFYETAVIVCVIVIMSFFPDNYGGLCRYELVYSPSQAWEVTGVQYLAPVLIMGSLYIRIVKIARAQVSNIAGCHAESYFYMKTMTSISIHFRDIKCCSCFYCFDREP